MTRIRVSKAFTSGGWVSDVDVTVEQDGRIHSIGKQEDNPDISVDLLLPALTNLHSHSFQRAMSGLTETRGPDGTDSFWSWRKLMYKFLQQLTPNHVEAIAAQVFMEIAEAGYSAVAEFHYLHHDKAGIPYDNLAELAQRIASAAQETGIGLTLLPVHYEFGGCDRRTLEGGQMRFGNTKDQFARLYAKCETIIAAGHADWNLGVAPHSLRAVDPEGLRLARDIAPDRPFHMHLAEQLAEVEEVEQFLGARPVEWVLENLPVDERCCFIHCTQMNSKETVALASSGAIAGLCPITESSLGDGIFDCATYFGANGSIGVGSDSNIHISLWDELKTLEYSQRLRDRKRAVLADQDRSTGRAIFESALCGGAKAAGRESAGIKEGQWADLLGISTDNEFLCNRHDDTVLDSLIFSGGGQSCISEVWSAGRHIVQNGRHVMRQKITGEFIKVLKQLEQGI